MQPPLNPYGDEGVGRLQLTQKAEAICVDLHTSAVHRFFLLLQSMGSRARWLQ